MLRALVTGWRRLELSVQAPRISAAELRLEKISVAPTVRAEPRFEVALQRLASMLGYQAPVSVASWVALAATNIEILVGALNRYLADSFGLSDAPAINTGKGITDLPQVIEELSLHAGKVSADEAILLDDIILILSLFRDFTDSVSFSDDRYLDIGLGPVDTPVLTEQKVFDLSQVQADTAFVVEEKALAFATIFDDAFAVAQDSQDLATGKGLFDSASLSEAQELDLSLVYSDESSLLEDHAIDLETFADDGFSVQESFERSVVFRRAESDATGVSDEDTYDWDKGLTEAPTLSEDHAFSITKPLSDSASIGDQDVLDVILGKTETPILTENLSRTVTYNRSFSDSISLDDQSSVTEHHRENKTNVVAFADDQDLRFGKVLSDGATVSESLALHVFSGAKALNGRTLNSAPINL